MNDPRTTDVVVNDTGRRFPHISWGAIFAGAVVVLSLSWLLHMLGLAIGVSSADAMDSATMEGGADEMAAIWSVLSWLITFFVGAMVAARLAGWLDDFSGMLHGLVLWGVATIAVVVLSYLGISSLLQTGQTIVAATAQGAATAVTTTAQGVGSAASGLGSMARQAADTEFGDTLQNLLADQAAEAAAGMDEELSEEEIRTAINNLDQRTLRRIVNDLADDDQQGASELLANATTLSQSDARALIDGAYQELEQAIGDPESGQPLAEDLKNQLARQVDTQIASLGARGGPETTPQDVRRAINQLDAETMQALAMKIAGGDVQGAKRVLAQNTNLSSAQIEDLYVGAQQGIQEELESYQAVLSETMETVTDYTQAILWVSFGGAAMALVVSLGGGWLGAHSGRQAYADTVDHSRGRVAT